MWGNKDNVFRSWRTERDLGLELEKQFSKQIGSGGMSNPHISPYKISTDQSASLFWSTIQIHLAVSHCCSSLLTPTLCPAVQPNLFRKNLFFKSGASVYLQNDLFSVYLSKLKVVCHISMSPVATVLHILPTRVLSHDQWFWDASRPTWGFSWKTAFKELT